MVKQYRKEKAKGDYKDLKWPSSASLYLKYEVFKTQLSVGCICITFIVLLYFISFLSRFLLLAVRISLPFLLIISRFLLIQVYKRSGTLHWFVAVVMPLL